MADDDAPVRHAEGLRRLDVLQLAQLQRLAAQQSAQSGPAGDAEDEAQRQQAQVGAFGRSREPLRMGVDDHLHHQHGSRDEQHAGNRVEYGVQVLDHVIDPAAEIAGDDAEQHGHGEHDQRRDQADDQAGAHALEDLIEHVLPHLVGAEHVVLAGQPEQRHDNQQHHAEREQHRVPGKSRLATPDFPPPGSRRAVIPADNGRSHPSHRQPAEESQNAGTEGGKACISSHLVLAFAEMLTTMLEARVVAHRALARHVDSFLGIQAGGERLGVGFLVARAQGLCHGIEQRQHLDGVLHLLPRLAFQRHPVMQGIEQADHNEREQHGSRGHADPIGTNPAPRREQGRIPCDQQANADPGGDKQPDQQVGPQDDDLDAHHSKRIRGSTSV